MRSMDDLIVSTSKKAKKENGTDEVMPFVFANKEELYLVYLPDGGSASLDLTKENKSFKVRWFNPREGGKLQKGSVSKVNSGKVVDLGTAPANKNEDWLVVLQIQ
jgi:hypothetical protein